MVKNGIIEVTSTDVFNTLAKKSSYNKKTKAQREESETVKTIVDNFNACWDYTQSNYHTTWERAWKLYNNKRVMRGYDGISDVFVPMTFSTIETMVAALAGGKPSFDFIPPKENKDQNTEVLNALLDAYWDRDQWDIKVQSFIRSMLMFGTSVLYVQWDIDHPVISNVPIRDFFFDPNATSIENPGDSFYCGRRYLTTKEDLESFEIVDNDPNSKTYGEMVKKYKNLDQITESSGSKDGDETDKEKKDLFYGSTATNPEATQVEVIEYWTADKVCSIANRSVLIQEEENPYKQQARERGDENATGIIPFVIQRNYVDESLLLGKGEIETFSDLQEWLNDLTNQNNDAITFTLNPMWNINPDKQDLKEQIQSVPGAVFPLNPSDLVPVAMPQIPREAFNERINIKNEIRETTAVDQVVKGVSQSSNATATEIQSQIANAGQRLAMKITQLENEGFHRLARVVFEMIKLYVDEPTDVRVASNDGTRWENFNPEEFRYGDYEPRVQLESTVAATKKEETNQYKEIFQAFLGDPDINQKEIKKLVLQRAFDLDPDEVKKLTEVDPMGMGLPPEMGGMGLPPEIEAEMGVMPPMQTPTPPMADELGVML